MVGFTGRVCCYDLVYLFQSHDKPLATTYISSPNRCPFTWGGAGVWSMSLALGWPSTYHLWLYGGQAATFTPFPFGKQITGTIRTADFVVESGSSVLLYDIAIFMSSA